MHASSEPHRYCLYKLGTEPSEGPDTEFIFLALFEEIGIMGVIFDRLFLERRELVPQQDIVVKIFKEETCVVCLRKEFFLLFNNVLNKAAVSPVFYLDWKLSKPEKCYGCFVIWNYKVEYVQ